MTSYQHKKVEMRRLAQAARADAMQALPNYGALFMRQFVKFDVPQGAIISGYRAMFQEVDVEPILTLCHVNGHALALPVVIDKGQPLAFRSYKPGDPLQGGRYGIEEPLPTVPFCEPDVLLIPLIAFDRRGARLGYGGGYYDRTVAALRCKKDVMAVGIALSAQEMPDIPLEPHDAMMDYVVTEKEIIRCSVF